MLCEHSSKVVTCGFVISVFKVGIWDVLCHLCKRCQVANDFALGAPNKPRFSGLDNITSLMIFSHNDLYLVGNLKDCS